MEAWEKRDRPVSTIWWWCHSEYPLCSGACGGMVRWEILLDAKNVARAWYFSLLSE